VEGKRFLWQLPLWFYAFKKNSRRTSASAFQAVTFLVTRAPNFWPIRQAQRLAGGKALGELEANPQLNCYRWY
jgi:hypothetical protein